MFNATRFKTLMLREWLQNRWTWLIAVSALPALVLLVLPFVNVALPQKMPPTFVATAVLLITAVALVWVAWATTLFTATSLARRDVQDRSIEFWMSLPSTHTEHVGSQYLMHALLFPVGALVLGFGLGAVMSPLVLFKWQGMAALGAVEWTHVGAAAMQFMALAGASLVFTALWLSPVVMVLMAASAWVKRLALPLIAVVMAFLAYVPPIGPDVRAFLRGYGDCINQLSEGVARVMASSFPKMRPADAQMANFGSADFLGQAFSNFATPQFAVAMAVAGVATYLLVLRRRQGG